MRIKNFWMSKASVAVLLSSIILTACGHTNATLDDEISPRTFPEFELIEARENRERLRTLKQLKTKRASGS